MIDPPTERFAQLYAQAGEPPEPPPFDYCQPLVIDTTKIRESLGCADIVDERLANDELARGAAPSDGTEAVNATAKDDA